jgi:aspartate-semialdehyde dehydrogenase
VIVADGIYRIGIVGASSLAGKELADELGESMLATSSLVLLDDEDVTGQITSAGDEISFIQRLDADSFQRMDFAFFTGGADVTRAQWQNARKAGATIIDFQPLPKEHYDAQVSFNLLPSLGEAAKVELTQTQQRIADHYETLSAGRLPELALQLVHAPVFHGYTASMLVELEEPASVEQVEAALAGVRVDVVGGESDPPSNLSAAGQENVLVRVTSAGKDEVVSRRFWLWLAADNLKLAAGNGVACALELRRLRPRGKVQ